MDERIGALSDLLPLAYVPGDSRTHHSIRECPESVEHFVDSRSRIPRRCSSNKCGSSPNDSRPVTLDEILLSMHGKIKLPRREVAVTFDDGYGDSYEIAAPILARHGVSAAFYVSTGPIRDGSEFWFVRLRPRLRTRPLRTGRIRARRWCIRWPIQRRAIRRIAPPASCALLVGDEQYAMVDKIEAALAIGVKLDQRFMLSWEQVWPRCQSGHIVGATRDIIRIWRKSTPIALWPSCGSKADLEEAVGEPIMHFAYPTPFLIEPHYSENTIAMTRRLGFQTAATWLRGARCADRAGAGPAALAAPLDMEEFPGCCKSTCWDMRHKWDRTK